MSLMVLVLAAGCGRTTSPQPTSTMIADPPVTQWSDVSTLPQPTLVPTQPGQINYEPTASAVGQVPYSGYNCTITTDSCTCDQAVVVKAGFTFATGDQMSYQFRGDTYGAQWNMSRLGPNQWSYTIPIGADQSGGKPPVTGHYFIVLTFSADGFTLLQREEMSDGTKLTCPEVGFTRLSAATPSP
jgi:hypothetical protein